MAQVIAPAPRQGDRSEPLVERLPPFGRCAAKDEVFDGLEPL